MVREEDITKEFSTIYDIAMLLRTSPEQVLSWVKAGDILFSVGKNKDNKILVHRRYLIDFLREEGLLIKKSTPVRNVLIDYWYTWGLCPPTLQHVKNKRKN